MAANAINNSMVNQVKSLNSNDKILLKRIKDLEAQNERLRKHVGQAEDAIRNYRGFMSARSESPGDESRKCNDKGCQTLDPMDFMQAQQNELKELRRKLMAAEKTNERLTAMQASAKKSESSDIGSKKKANVNADAINDEKVLLKLQLEAREAQASCEQKDKEIERFRKQAEKERSVRVNLGSTVNKLLHAARELKSGFQADKKAVEEELTEHRVLLGQIATKLTRANEDRERQADEAEKLKSALNLREMQLNSAELACEEARAEVVKWKEQFHNLEKSIQAKQEAAIVTAKEVANVLAAAAERSGKVEQEKNNSSKDDVITELREKNKALSSERENICQVLVSARQTEKS